MRTTRLLLALIVSLALAPVVSARVQGPAQPPAGEVPGQLEDNGDGTVTDGATGLMWQKGYAAGLDRRGALAYVRSLALGGFSDWRLPSVQELRGITDSSRDNTSTNTTASFNPLYFDGPEADQGAVTPFWSGTAGGEAPPAGLAVSVGPSALEASGARNYVRAVRDGSFALTSEVGVDGGTLPVDCTCDGSGASPDMSWSNAPSGTAEFALLMSTIPVDGNTKWNWVVYGIPATVTGLARNSTGVGVLGVSSRGSRIYEPPCSQGPGAKVYTFTIYALSSSPQLPSDPDQVTGAAVTQAIAGITLGQASLSLSYTRPDGPPTAAFTFAPAAPVTGETVSFADSSSGGPGSWSWDFGDGGASTLQNPTHPYAAPGAYTVSLTAANAKGSDTATSVLTVASPCAISGVEKIASPFRLKVSGLNFQSGCSVLVNGSPAPTTLFKSAALLVAKGEGLGAMVPRATSVEIVVKNPDGTQSAPFSYTR